MDTSRHFFCLEGIDGCGKSTQLELLAKELRSEGLDVLCIREPGGSEISERIRSLLLDIKYKGIMNAKAELLLYNAARAQVISEKIKPALDAGNIVLADRFAWSTLAYQGYGRGLDTQMVSELSQIACGKYFPELTIVLDIDVLEGHKRMAGENRTPDRLESEAASFFERVRQGYKQMALDFPNAVVVVDASQSVDRIHKEILSLVKAKL